MRLSKIIKQSLNAPQLISYAYILLLVELKRQMLMRLCRQYLIKVPGC